MLRRQDSNLRPLGYEPNELPTAPLRDIVSLNGTAKIEHCFGNTKYLANFFIFAPNGVHLILKLNPMADSVVIIPTYNEKENIEQIINAVFSLDKEFHILVIDDGSPDGTAAIVQHLMSGPFQGRLFLEERKGKMGLGTAYIHGFKWSLQRTYDYIFEMDADFSHNPEDLPRLYAACHDEGYDVAVGSRYATGVNVVNWPMGRVLMSFFASKYVRLVTALNVKDTTAGFVCYRRKVLETIDLDQIRFKGYAFQIEMKYSAKVLGFSIKEVSVIFVNRQLGTSKMNSSIFGEAFFGVINLRWRKELGQIKPRKQTKQLPS
jgi:dolichol-phosphate mannosyltransferase